MFEKIVFELPSQFSTGWDLLQDIISARSKTEGNFDFESCDS